MSKKMDLILKDCSNPLTEGTLKWWAKMDNENAYTEIREENLI